MPRNGLKKYLLLFFLTLNFLIYGEEQELILKRTDLSDGSNLRLKNEEGMEIISLKETTKFYPNNTFSIRNIRVKVNFLSENLQVPDFELKKQKKFLDENPLHKEEVLLLQYAGLFLYPQKSQEKGEHVLKVWIDDLDNFFELHEKDLYLVKTIQSFILKYVNEPYSGHIIGDQLWDKNRKIVEWYQFYDLPYYYDLNGRILTIDEKPIIELPLQITIDKLAVQTKLYPIVIRNLEYSFESLKTLILEAENSINVLPEISSARRIYLTIKLLRVGENMWHNLKK